MVMGFFAVIETLTKLLGMVGLGLLIVLVRYLSPLRTFQRNKIDGIDFLLDPMILFLFSC